MVAAMSASKTQTRSVFCLAYEDCQLLDVAGPLEALSKANELGAPDSYRATLLAEAPGPLATSGGLRLVADRAYDAVGDGELEGLHTLIVAGGRGALQRLGDSALIDFVRRAARHAERLVSICSGSLILAEASLLDGRRATSHWDVVGELARRYPAVTVEADPIYIQDGHVWTSAGVTAGIDLTLALIEADLGRELALAVARQLVVYMMRPGGQTQFSVRLAAARPTDSRLRVALDWIERHTSERLTVAELAERCAMSERSFSRRFAAETGMTPARFVEQIRLDRARRLLEESDLQLERLASDCGFNSAEVMRRLFQRNFGLSPSQYRERFHTAIRC